MSLTVYLLKPGIDKPEDALKKGNNLQLVSKEEDDLKVFIYKPQRNKPRWISFFQEKFSELKNLYNSNSGCLMFVKAESDDQDFWFVVTFGAVWHQLNDQSIEHEFGIRTALNLIEPNSLKTVEVRRVEDGTLQEKKSQSKTSKIDDFDVDVDRILLNAISGNSRDQEFAKSVIGKEGIKLSSKQDINTIKEFCKKLLHYYQSEQFKQDYKWYGKINKVKDRQLTTKLNEILLNNLQDQNSEVYFAAPDILDEWLIDSFRFQGLGRYGTFDELTVSHLQDAISKHDQKDWSIQTLEGINVQGLDLSGQAVKSWPLLKCFVFEVSQDNRHYLLSRGSWFEVDKDFKDSVETAYNSIERSTVSLPKFSKSTDKEKKIKDGVEKEHLSEGAYNIRASKALSFILLDKVTPHVDGRNSAVELCDFMSPDKRLFHIKCQIDGFKSQTLSSLFMQGYVSGTVLKNSKDYRTKIIERVPECKSLLPDVLNASDYEYCFGIVSNKPENLPFFSKISLNKTVENLRSMDYKVSICWIGVEE